jgi:hypothetical protein
MDFCHYIVEDLVGLEERVDIRLLDGEASS